MESPVSQFFKDKVIFLTGGTGFLGKCLLEKLLWSVDTIDSIYLLVRARKGRTVVERIPDILKDPLFDRLRTEYPERLELIKVVAGDVKEHKLGISDDDWNTLCQKVNVVVHSAATVKFDEQLRDAVGMNLGGTQKMIELCKQMKHLQVFVHVSTAYANCDRKITSEMIYEAPIDPEKMVDALSWMDNDMVDMITPKVLGGRPNTYTLTKALAESYLQNEASDLPIVVVRPSIIGAMWGSPLPGWMDNVNGPTGIFTGVGKGVLTNMCGSPRSKADIIPVDIVSNTIIVAAYLYANKTSTKLPVIHCTSGEQNPLQWKKVVYYLEQFFQKYPMTQCYSVPSTELHLTRSMFLINYYVKHHIPALFLDKIKCQSGQRNSYSHLYGKVWRMVEALHFFTSRGWTFECNMLPQMISKMTEYDRHTYPMDIRKVNWDSYLFDYMMGVKRYILREKLEDLPKAQSNLVKLRAYRISTVAAMWALFVRVMCVKYKKHTKWFVWFSGFVTTNFILNNSWRPTIQLKSLENYVRHAGPDPQWQ